MATENKNPADLNPENLDEQGYHGGGVLETTPINADNIEKPFNTKVETKPNEGTEGIQADSLIKKYGDFDPENWELNQIFGYDPVD